MKFAVVLLTLAVSISFGDTVVSRIGAAVETDALTPDEAVFMLYNSVYDASRVPAQFREGTVPEPCGTPAFDMIVSLYDHCSAPVRDELDVLLARPYPGDPYYTTISPDDLFKIHWTTAGVNATNENYVNTLAEAFDTSWETLCTTLGFWTPPVDMGLGGCDRYDVYIMSLESGTLGYCSTGGEVPNPVTPNNDWSSHIAMSNNEGYGQNQMIETSAHEFMHAIQNAYDTAEPTWFKENCTVWAQNIVFETNLYTDYLKSGENCLRRPWYDIRTGAMYHYGASPWPMYMQYRTGGTVEAVQRVWEIAADYYGANLMESIEAAAAEYGFTFNQWLAEYTCWRWFTGSSRADDEHYPYEESSLWGPGAYVFSYHNVTSLPASLDNGVYPPETYGNHWIQINVQPYQGWIQVDFDGRDNFDWILGVIRTKDDGTDDFYWTLVENSQATYEWGVETTGWDKVIVFPQPVSITTLDLFYEMDITYNTGIEEGTPASAYLLEASGNPYSGSGILRVTMPEAGPVTINVYNAAGRMVQTISAGELPEGQSSVNWNASGLENGTYFVRLTGPTGGVTARVTVLN